MSKYKGVKDISVEINYWTSEQIDLLKQLYPLYSNNELATILKHPKNSVSNKAIELGLKKQKWWTNEEIDLLNKYYSTLGAKELNNMFLPYRSVNSIKKKAHELGIKLNKNVAFKIRDNNLNGRLTASLTEHPDFKNCKDLRCIARNRTLKWRKEVLDYYDNTCILSGEKENIVVHHIYPFSKIFYNTLSYYEDNYSFKRNDDMKKCIELNGLDLVENFLNDIYNNHKISHGAVISECLHNLFHNRYGTYYFTKEDFYEFVQDYNNGVYKGVVRHEQ